MCYMTYGTLYLEPYLDKYCKQYRNIITLNAIPIGPLAHKVAHIRMPAVSEFATRESRCKYAILRDDGKYMESEDLPELMAFMTSNGYIIDYKMTNMLEKHTGHLICTFYWA